MDCGCLNTFVISAKCLHVSVLLTSCIKYLASSIYKPGFIKFGFHFLRNSFLQTIAKTLGFHF